MYSALSNFQTKDSPSGKVVGGQIDIVILAQNTAETQTQNAHMHVVAAVKIL